MHLPRAVDTITISRHAATRRAESSLCQCVSLRSEAGKRVRLLALYTGSELGPFVDGDRCLRPKCPDEIFWNDLKLAAKGLSFSIPSRIYQGDSSMATEPFIYIPNDTGHSRRHGYDGRT